MKLNIVPARTGMTWVKLGIATFLKQPLALAGLFFLYMAAIFLLSQIPVIGPVLASVLMPACSLGIMVATKEASTGRFPMPALLVSSFRAGRQRAGATLILGVVYAAGWFIALNVATLLAPPPAPQMVGTAAGQGELGAFYLAVTVLTLPLTILLWHAPALVHWHGVTPLKSMFFSFVACFRNLGALTVFAATWVGIGVVALLLIGLVGLLIGATAVLVNIVVPVFLLLLAMFSTSVYFTFRDSFVADESTPTGEPP